MRRRELLALFHLASLHEDTSWAVHEKPPDVMLARRTGYAHEAVLDVALCLLYKHLNIAHRCFILSDCLSVSTSCFFSISLTLFHLQTEIYALR